MLTNKLLNTVITNLSVLAITFSIYSYSCDHTNNKADSIASVQLTFVMPGLNEEGVPIELRDTLVILYYGDLVMYEIPLVSSSYKTIVDRDGHIIKQELVKTEIYYQYAVHRKGNTEGLKYDSINALTGQNFSIDSFLNRSWIRGFKRMYELDKTNDTLVKSEKRNNILIDTYSPKIKYDASFNDSSYYYYKEWPSNIDFSFSQELDSVKKMKLFKIEVVYNFNQQATDPYQKLAKRFLFEMTETPVKDSVNILRLFKRFENERQK